MSFGYSHSFRGRVQKCTPQLFYQALDNKNTALICAEIEDALEKVKRGEMSREDFEKYKSERKKELPILTPHATFRFGQRKNDTATPSGLSMYDVDHISLTPNPSPKGEGSIYQRLVNHTLAKEPITDEGMIAELKQLGICLVHVTPSTEGFRLFFVMPEGMNLAKAQKWMSEQLGDAEYDGSVKDLARASFLVPRDYLLYIDEEELFKDREYTMVEDAEIVEEVKTVPTVPPAQPSNATFPDNYNGIPFTKILKKYWEKNNHGFEPNVGDRDTLTYQLACDLRHICGKNFEWLDQIIPCYNGFSLEEKQSKIRGALKSPYESMPQRLKGVLDELMLPAKDLTVEENDNENENDKNPCPEMPKKLPKLIQLLVSRTPDVYKPAVSHAVFPSLGAHLYKTRFRYIDNVEHEATLMNVLMAGTGAGKECISEPINHIMADIRRRDMENLAREKAWKDENMRKGSNKDKNPRPEGLVIQEIDSDMTGPAFILRTAEADEHFLYAKLNEIDQFDALRGNGGRGQQFRIMCLAFDPGNRYGQTRVGMQSVTEKVCIRFNWNAATTIQKGMNYFRNVLTDGPISRINFCTIPEREIGAPMPLYGTYDAQFDEDLRPYIERLCAARGTIACPEAYKLAQKLCEECAEFSRLSQSRVYENLSFRALVIAYLKACVLYVAHDYTWDKTMEDFIRWSLQYDLWCKMQFFGSEIERCVKCQNAIGMSRPRNLLVLLPNDFTFEDAVRIRREQGFTPKGTQDMIRAWRNRGYIEERTDERTNRCKFTKLKYKS